MTWGEYYAQCNVPRDFAGRALYAAVCFALWPVLLVLMALDWRDGKFPHRVTR